MVIIGTTFATASGKGFEGELAIDSDKMIPGHPKTVVPDGGVDSTLRMKSRNF